MSLCYKAISFVVGPRPPCDVLASTPQSSWACRLGAHLYSTVALLITMSQLAVATPVKVHVRNDAQIATSNIELGSIADISATNVGDELQLSSLILGEAPEAGKTVVWTAAEVSKRLRPYNRRLLQSEVQLKIPDQITIRRVVNGVTREELKRKIEEMLKATLPDSTWEAQLREVNLPQHLDNPHDGSVQVVPLTSRPRGATQFQVEIQRNGKTESRQWFTGHVAYFTNVPVIQRLIEPRTHILESDVKWQRRDVTYINDIPATSDDLHAAVTKMTLTPGTVLTRSSLEREMALHFGEEVEVRAGDDSFSVSSRGVAQQNGFIGDLVRVKSTTAGGRVLTGVLVARGVVEIHY